MEQTRTRPRYGYSVGAASTEKLSVSMGQKADMSFPLGECPEHYSSWSMVKMKPDGVDDIFSCYKGSPKRISDRVRGECPNKGEHVTVQLSSVQLSDLGTYCLEINQETCSCFHLDIKNESSLEEIRAELTTSTIPPVSANTTAPVNLGISVGLPVLILFVIGGLCFWKRKQIRKSRFYQFLTKRW